MLEEMLRASRGESEGEAAGLLSMAKRCVTSLVRPVRHWPPSARIPAERTSRSCAGSYDRGLVSARLGSSRVNEPRENIVAGSGE